MDILRRMDWNGLVHEYDLDGSRLLPWPGLSMPFGGGWCVVRPGTDSMIHHHAENELFIIISGAAKIMINETAYEVNQGDIVAIPPGENHFVRNDTTRDFQFYTIWWDADSAIRYLNTEEVNG